MTLNYPFLLCLFLTHSLAANDDSQGIHPYNHERDQAALTALLLDNFKDIVSNNGFLFKNDAEKRIYAEKTTRDRPLFISQTSVMRENGKTIGYVEYIDLPVGTNFSPLFSCNRKGKIHQLAVDKNFRGKKYGELLCNHALNELQKNDIFFAEVITTTPEVGENFYQNKLNFELYRKTRDIHVEALHVCCWRKYFKPTLTQRTIATLTKFIKKM